MLIFFAFDRRFSFARNIGKNDEQNSKWNDSEWLKPKFNLKVKNIKKCLDEWYCV